MTCYSQGKLSIKKGSSVQFIFESFRDIENGKTLGSGTIGYTTIEVSYQQLVNPSSWVLDIRANSASFLPDYGATSIDLNEMTMDVYLDNVFTGNYILTTLDQTIATATGDYSAEVKHTITITYHFAEPNGLIGFNSDFFSNDLIITFHN